MALDRPLYPSVEQITDIEVLAKKTGGTRGGFIGAHHNMVYVVKVEFLGYSNAVVGIQAECCAVESFTAQLIRQIWGEDYAADIRLIPLPSAKQPEPAEYQLTGSKPIEMTLLVPNPHAVDKKYNGPFQPTEERELKLFSYTPQAVISLYEQPQHYTSMFNASKADQASTREEELIVIGKLLGISDLKIENTILGNKGTRKFIDCAATFTLLRDKIFYGVNNDKSFDALIDNPHGRKILQDYLNFPSSKFDALLAAYEKPGYLSTETTQAIRANISAVMQEIAQYKVEAQPANDANKPHTSNFTSSQ